jgi:hypothetical protein
MPTTHIVIITKDGSEIDRFIIDNVSSPEELAQRAEAGLDQARVERGDPTLDGYILDA